VQKKLTKKQDNFVQPNRKPQFFAKPKTKPFFANHTPLLGVDKAAFGFCVTVNPG